MRPPLSIALVVFGPTAPTREVVAALLTPEELEDAQKRARAWQDAFEKRDLPSQATSADSIGR